MEELSGDIDSRLSQAIVSTISEPLIILDENQRVLIANPAFYAKFQVDPSDTEEKFFFELGNGQWDIPQLQELLKKILKEKTVIEEYEVNHTFPELGERVMIVNAREVKYQNGNRKVLLLIQDVTENRKLMHQKDVLLKEMRHRIANSLQLIASILILKAADVTSDESKEHLQDAHDRIMSIATVQRNLDPTGDNHEVPVTEYLETLCASLAKSMIGGRKPISIHVNGSEGGASPDEAISLGLITTELVVNALKHAFPGGEGAITATYLSDDLGWSLSIADNGVGFPQSGPLREGLGTNILDSLAGQLNAVVDRKSTSEGTVITVAHRNA